MIGEMWPGEGWRLLVSFRVDGDPKPAGSKDTGVVTRWDPVLKRRVPVERPGGGYMTFAKDSSGQPGKDWRADVRSACADALEEAHELADGPLAVRVTFYCQRPKGHFGTGRNAGTLKVSADAFPHQSRMADGTKLTRALEDALTKIVWTDDRRVCECWWTREFGRPGAEVQIFAMPVTVEDRRGLRLLDAGDEGYHGGGYEREGTATVETLAV